MNSIHQVIMFNFGKHDTNNVQKINLTRFYYDKLNVNMKKTRLWYKFIHWTNDEQTKSNMKKYIYIYTLLKTQFKKNVSKYFKFNQYISKYLKEFSLGKFSNYIMNVQWMKG